MHGGDIYNVSKELNKDYKEVYDFSANINPLGLSKAIKDSITENVEKLVLSLEKTLSLEKMKGFPTDKINFINEEFTTLNVAVRTLENFEGTGKSLIIIALNSTYVNVRYGAANTLEEWKEKGYIFSDEIIENIKNLEKIEVNEDLKEKLNKLLK